MARPAWVETLRRGQEEEEKPSPAPRQEAHPDYRRLYQEIASNPFLDDFPLVDAWLAHHPAFWHRIRELDDILTRLEQEGVDEGTYRGKLGEMVELCRKVKAMKEGEGKRRVLAPHHCGGTHFWLSRYSDLWICEKCTPPPEADAVKRWAEASEEIGEGMCFTQ